MSFLDKVKKAGKSVVDAGAKTMLKVGETVTVDERVGSGERCCAALFGLSMRMRDQEQILGVI